MSKILDKIVIRDSKTGISEEYSLQDTVLKNRVELIIANNGNTEGNSELIDIRVDYNGNTHKTAGDSVRFQINGLQNQLNDLNKQGLVINGDYITLKVNDWLKDHPEMFTTVMDGAITEKKIEENFLYDLKKFRLYNSIFDLITDEKVKQGQTCKTLGYNYLNDGKGAYYYIREKTETDVDDGKNIHNLQNNLVAEFIIDTATNAINDGEGNEISSTYVKIDGTISFNGRLRKTESYADGVWTINFPHAFDCESVVVSPELYNIAGAEIPTLAILDKTPTQCKIKASAPSEGLSWVAVGRTLDDVIKYGSFSYGAGAKLGH